MNIKPLRATLVFLFAASLAACSGTSNMMPAAPTAPIAQSGGRDIHSQCVPGPGVNGGLGIIACSVGTGGDGLGGGFAGGGGGAGAGNCNGGGLVRLTVANPCTGVSSWTIAYANGPAQYNDQCTPDSQAIGHSVESTQVGPSTAIINEYPLNVRVSLLTTITVGNVYTTWGNGYGQGGSAYFSPVGSAVGIGIISVGVGSATYVGPNSLTQNFNKIETIVGKLVGKTVTAALGGGNDACFSSNWNGSHSG